MTADKTETLSVVVAGGGTAGHIEPAMAVAEAVRHQYPGARITALGTARGLETTLVPQRNVDLRLIPAVPVSRKINKELLSLPLRVNKAVREAKKILREVNADVVIGFGGYVSAPAYLAAKSLGLPFFVHEANACAGMANKLGVRLGGVGLAAVPNSGLEGEVIGIPVRQSVLSLNVAATRAEAREFFGLKPDSKVLLVTGGSQGAASINNAMVAAADTLIAANISVLHAFGKKNSITLPDNVAASGNYVAVPYIERMDLALAAADMILCRSGAMTVAEVSAVGLPAVYVPLPHGNGEQALNAKPIVDAGGGEIIADADLTAQTIAQAVIPTLRNDDRLAAAGEAARSAGHRGASEKIATMLADAARPEKSCGN